MLVLAHPTAPIITIRRTSDEERDIVPVLFAAGALPTHKWLYEKTDGLVPMIHHVSAARTGQFLVVPFLFDRFGDVARFRGILTSVLRRHALFFDLAWFIAQCHVVITEAGINYGPLLTVDGLRATQMSSETDVVQDS